MRRVVMVAFAALLMVPLFLKSRMNRDMPVHTAFQVLSGNRILVKVSGAVRHAGIYEVPANTMADSVIKMAVSLHPGKRITIGPDAAAPLQNGAALRLVLQGDGSLRLGAEPMTVPERLVLGIPLDITTMGEDDFDRLPGIGPALARRIIDYRQNNGGILRVADLAMIEGIGEKRYKLLRAYFQPP